VEEEGGGLNESSRTSFVHDTMGILSDTSSILACGVFVFSAARMPPMIMAASS
jgi:hypothetical protein